MAFYKVLEVSYIGGSIRQEGEVVEINDDPTTGGMRPKGNLAKCDKDGNLTAAKGAKAQKAQADKPGEGGDLT